uniref:Plastid lipid-associated protein/fibrillin conserved domain-containing protein n=1 Tax=Fibrocapsa japonica TaxID=94617 RepID=A0A7S2XYV4_9STRA
MKGHAFAGASVLVMSLMLLPATAFLGLGVKPTGTAEGVKQAQKVEGLKTELKQICASTPNGVGASKQAKQTINSIAQELNKLNKIKTPAKSKILRGKWRLLYSDVPGPSSGKIGPVQADVFQDLDLENMRVKNILELGPDWALRGALEADAKILDNQTWQISFDYVYNNFLGTEVQRKQFDPNMENRIWNMTYLDSNFRILYGNREGAADSEEGFIFVMERAD